MVQNILGLGDANELLEISVGVHKKNVAPDYIDPHGLANNLDGL